MYQLSDYFTLFYYKFLKTNYGKNEHFWSHSIDNPSVRAWAGFTFEQICKDYERTLMNKIERFRKATDTKKALHLTMITTYGTKQNMHAGNVQSQVTLDDLFTPGE